MVFPSLSEFHNWLCYLGKQQKSEAHLLLKSFTHSSSFPLFCISVNITMKSTLWWGTAHALATILHLVMGVVGIVTFHNTAIQALNDFMSGVTVGSSSIGLMSEASLLQGVIAVVSQLPPNLGAPNHACPVGKLTIGHQQGCIGFFFNLTQYMTLLWTEHKISSHNSRSWYFKRKVAVLSGLLVSCGVFIGDIALAAMLGLKNKNVAIGPIAASAVAG